MSTKNFEALFQGLTLCISSFSPPNCWRKGSVSSATPPFLWFLPCEPLLSNAPRLKKSLHWAADSPFHAGGGTGSLKVTLRSLTKTCVSTGLPLYLPSPWKFPGLSFSRGLDLCTGAEAEGRNYLSQRINYLLRPSFEQCQGSHFLKYLLYENKYIYLF